ncbi:hypothetical protein [Streptomyces sp. NBC_00338]|uniref:hypothetical protein n=1 Tax=Streptomyces sp. NBC_00338 TaxID=2975715 RepID=UPI002254D2FE|nr:hypothetical protein [Streptomyces sp. NBC_00338]MCX5145118.1 hypothetical protein [Streptomyces sp. NBC_00338]
MFGRKSSTSAAEVATRSAQVVGRTVAGDRGGKVANKVTGALGLGRIEKCADPKCDCCN